MKIIHRYVVADYLKLFVICCVAVTILSVGNLLFNMSNFLVGYRTPVSLVLRLVKYRLPYLLLDVIPVAVMFAAYLSVGRMAREKELDVVRTSGWSFMRIVYPILLVTLIISTLAFVWYDTVVPFANRKFEKDIRTLRFRDALPLFTENVFIKGPENRYFYVRRINNRTEMLEGIMIFETAGLKYPRIITAQKGRIFRQNWALEDGVIHELDRNGWIRMDLSFDKMTLDSGNDLTGFFGEQYTMEEMTRAQLKEKMELFGKSGFDISVFAVEYYLKTAIPYASLVLVFIALPFACLLARRGKAMGIGIGLLLVLGYFFLQVFFRSLGQNAVVNPIMAAWIPNIAYFAIGLYLLYQTKR